MKRCCWIFHRPLQSTVGRDVSIVLGKLQAIILYLEYTHSIPHTYTDIHFHSQLKKKYISETAYLTHIRVYEIRRGQKSFLLWIQVEDGRSIDFVGEKIRVAFYHFSPASPTAILNYAFNHN